MTGLVTATFPYMYGSLFGALRFWLLDRTEKEHNLAKKAGKVLFCYVYRGTS